MLSRLISNLWRCENCVSLSLLCLGSESYNYIFLIEEIVRPLLVFFGSEDVRIHNWPTGYVKIWQSLCFQFLCVFAKLCNSMPCPVKRRPKKNFTPFAWTWVACSAKTWKNSPASHVACHKSIWPPTKFVYLFLAIGVCEITWLLSSWSLTSHHYQHAIDITLSKHCYFRSQHFPLFGVILAHCRKWKTKNL